MVLKTHDAVGGGLGRNPSGRRIHDTSYYFMPKVPSRGVVHGIQYRRKPHAQSDARRYVVTAQLSDQMPCTISTDHVPSDDRPNIETADE